MFQGGDSRVICTYKTCRYSGAYICTRVMHVQSVGIDRFRVMVGTVAMKFCIAARRVNLYGRRVTAYKLQYFNVKGYICSIVY